MSNLEKWIKAILNEDADHLSIGSVKTLQMIKHEFERLQKENAEWKEEYDRLAVVADFWQKKYYELNPIQQPNKIDNL
jgi:hypothetical protein